MSATRAHRLTAPFLALLLLAPALARAQDEADAPRQEQEVPVEATEFIHVEGSLPFVPDSNTIATKLPLTLARTPNNVGVVTEALFDQQNARTLNDALVNVSNLNVQPGFGVFDFFVVRGFDSLTSGLVLTDGAPEPESTYWQLYNVELVEVLKGPAGFLYGPNPLAGAVNLVRKQPGHGEHVRVGAGAGSFETFEGTVDLNYGNPRSDFALRLNALWRDAGSWRDGKDSTVVAVNPALYWQIDDWRSLNLNAELHGSDFTPDAGIPLLSGTRVPALDDGVDFNSSLDRSEQDIRRFQADYATEIGDHVRLRNKLYYRSLDWRSDGTLINGAFGVALPREQLPTPTGFLVSRSLILLDDRQEFLGNQLEAILELDTGGIAHDLLAGLELARFGDEFTLDVGTLPPVSAADPLEPDRLDVTLLPGQRQAGEPRSLVLAPYVVDQISLSERVQLTAGARLDVIDFDDDVSGRERSDTEVSPMLGAVWMPTGDVSVYGNYSRSFAPPSFRARGDLEPERSRQVEAGVKLHVMDRRLQATAAVYHLERDNIPIPDDNGFTQQIGDQRSRGFELELAVEPSRRLRAVASYAYNDAELTRFAEAVLVPSPTGFVPVTVDRSGNRPAFAPEHMLRAWASATLESGLGIGLGARYLGEQFIAEDNAFAIDDALTLEASLSYTLGGLRASLNARNLTDTDTFLRAFGSQAVIPSAPTSIFLRLDYDV